MVEYPFYRSREIIPPGRGYRLDIYFRAGISLFHSHDFFEILHVARGRGIHLLGDVALEVTPGSTFIIGPGDVHKTCILADADVLLYNLAFEPQLLDPDLPREEFPRLSPAWPPHWKPFMVAPAQRRVPFGDELRERFSLFMTHLAEELADSRLDRDRNIQALFQLLVSCVNIAYEGNPRTNQKVRHTTDRVREATDFIDSHYRESIEVEDIARAVNLSSSRLSHSFKECLGMTLHQYLQNARVAESCNLIRNDTGIRISDIGTQVGFLDTSHFSRTFKRVTGLSPAAYRDLVDEQLANVNLQSEATYI